MALTLSIMFGIYIILGIIVDTYIVATYIVVTYLILKKKENERKGLSIISLYLSLLGLFFVFAGFPSLSIIAAILGFMVKNNEGPNKMATAGILIGSFYSVYIIFSNFIIRSIFNPYLWVIPIIVGIIAVTAYYIYILKVRKRN
ncbi:MAG: hypothetical protein ACTSWY_12320 [Promethearchaeota archaeon]